MSLYHEKVLSCILIIGSFSSEFTLRGSYICMAVYVVVCNDVGPHIWYTRYSCA